MTREVEIRKSDKVPYKQLSEAEQEIMDADSSLVDYRIEKMKAKRPLLETAVEQFNGREGAHSDFVIKQAWL